EYDVNKAKESIKDRLKKGQRRSRANLYRKMVVAASVILMLGMAFYLLYNTSEANGPVVKQQPHLIVAGTDKAILTLENGDEVALEKGKKFQTGKVRSNGEELVYT